MSVGSRSLRRVTKIVTYLEMTDPSQLDPGTEIPELVLGIVDELVGVVCYDLHPDSEVEIKTFGLLPEVTGKGMGGHALTLAIRQGWELTPRTRRLWLHTSSADSRNALPNYHRRGFRTFKIEEDNS